MQDDSEKLLKDLHNAEDEVAALRTELRKALEEAKRARADMHEFIEHLSRRTETGTPAEPTRDSLTTAPVDDGRPYVLHIEDNESSFRLVQQILRDMPEINLRRANCGRAGLASVKERIPRLILLDLNLPDIHGSEVLRILQQEPATAGIPVIVISADATPSQIERVLTAGARNYLTKPFDIRRFLIMVEKVLEDVGAANGAGTPAEPART